MKTFRLLSVVGFAVALGLAGRLHSQNAAAESLDTLKARNTKLLEEQQKTLDTLDVLIDEAAQIKVYAKRA